MPSTPSAKACGFYHALPDLYLLDVCVWQNTASSFPQECTKTVHLLVRALPSARGVALTLEQEFVVLNVARKVLVCFD